MSSDGHKLQFSGTTELCKKKKPDTCAKKKISLDSQGTLNTSQ